MFTIQLLNRQRNGRFPYMNDYFETSNNRIEHFSKFTHVLRNLLLEIHNEDFRFVLEEIIDFRNVNHQFSGVFDLESFNSELGRELEGDNEYCVDFYCIDTNCISHYYKDAEDDDSITSF